MLGRAMAEEAAGTAADRRRGANNEVYRGKWIASRPGAAGSPAGLNCRREGSAVPGPCGRNGIPGGGVDDDVAGSPGRSKLRQDLVDLPVARQARGQRGGTVSLSGVTKLRQLLAGDFRLGADLRPDFRPSAAGGAAIASGLSGLRGIFSSRIAVW